MSWVTFGGFTEGLDVGYDPNHFNLVPPTPSQLPLPPPYMTNDFQFAPPPSQNFHLQPNRPQLRSYHSNSSLASVSSDFSVQSRSSTPSTWRQDGGSDLETGTRGVDPKVFLLRPNLQLGQAENASRSPGPLQSEKVNLENGGGSPESPKWRKKSKGQDKKKSSHARKTDPEHIPRPRNAFILFRKHVVDSKLIPASVEVKHQNVSIITAKMWAEASAEEKERFNELARIEKEEHMRKYPGYRYQPVYRRTNVIRRRVRKDEGEEEKCRNVAELLMKGKKGEELESEINDKTKPSPGSGNNRFQMPGKTCGLSKGALRALRAQARTKAGNSDTWSEISRSKSVAPSVAGSTDLGSLNLEYNRHRRESIIAGSEVDEFDSPPQVQPQLFAGPAGGMDWFGMQELGQPQYSFPGVSGSLGHLSTPFQTYTYPQPGPTLQTNTPFARASTDYFTFDQALPFSPTAHCFFPQLSQDLSNVQPQVEPQPQNMPLFGSTPGAMGFSPLEFDDDGLLGDFGAALAQADELGW